MVSNQKHTHDIYTEASLFLHSIYAVAHHVICGIISVQIESWRSTCSQEYLDVQNAGRERFLRVLLHCHKRELPLPSALCIGALPTTSLHTCTMHDGTQSLIGKMRGRSWAIPRTNKHALKGGFSKLCLLHSKPSPSNSHSRIVTTMQAMWGCVESWWFDTDEWIAPYLACLLSNRTGRLLGAHLPK